MLMRHHWGLGVGHPYSHSDAPESLVIPPTPCTEAPSEQVGSLDLSQVASGSNPGPGAEIPGSADDAEADGDTASEDSELGLSDKEGNNLDADSDSEFETEAQHARPEAVEEDEPPQADEQPEPEIAGVPEAIERTPRREPSPELGGVIEVLEPEPAASTIRRSTRVRIPRRIWEPT
jgi:hypothetical protein